MNFSNFRIGSQRGNSQRQGSRLQQLQHSELAIGPPLTNIPNLRLRSNTNTKPGSDPDSNKKPIYSHVTDGELASGNRIQATTHALPTPPVTTGRREHSAPHDNSAAIGMTDASENGADLHVVHGVGVALDGPDPGLGTPSKAPEP